MRADQITHAEGRRDTHALLVRADRRRRRGRLRRAAQRLRADEGDDRGRRRRRALRGPALLASRSAATWAARCWCRPSEAIQKLVAARLAADVMGVPTVLIARTDADAANLLTSDVDERDRPLHHRRAHRRKGFFDVAAGLEPAIARGLAYAPYADMIWCETSQPDLDEARTLRRGDPPRVPGQAAGLQLLAVLQLEAPPRRRHHRRASSASSAAMGYKFQFVTLAGFHSLNAVHVRAGPRLPRPGHDRLRRAPGARVRARGAATATGRSSTRASSAPATSTTSPR